METINIEDYLLNMGWICIKGYDKNALLRTLGVKKQEMVNCDNGFEILVDSFDTKIHGLFEIDEWIVLFGKFYFLDNQKLIDITNKLSVTSEVVLSFYVDVWSHYYKYTKSIDGRLIRSWQIDDTNEEYIGEITVEEKMTTSKELANQIFELAQKMTIPFEVINDHFQTNELTIIS